MAIQRFSRNSKDNEGVVDPLQLFGNLSQTSYYQVDFSSLTTFPISGSDEITLLKFLEDRGIDKDFIARSSGLLCSEASLPATSLATGEVKDNFMGISQEFAHTRLYTDFDFTFYIDSDYKNLKFFESWIDYISGGSVAVPTQSNYYRRMRYPDSYKCQTISITKFEKNLNSGNTLKYSFINAFPKTISAVPVSYGNSDILRVNVSFNYDRYVVNATSGFTKGEQDEFKDIVQESAELQQRFNDREQSLAPTPTLKNNTGNRDPNKKTPLPSVDGDKDGDSIKTTAYKFDATRNYGIPNLGERFFTVDNKFYRAKNFNGNIVIYKDRSFFGNIGDVEITSSKTIDKTGNDRLFEELYKQSNAGSLTGNNFRDSLSF